MNPEIIDTMVRAAMQVMDNAYVPYGKAPIGACVLASDGTFYTGCNIGSLYSGRICVFITCGCFIKLFEIGSICIYRFVCGLLFGKLLSRYGILGQIIHKAKH